MENYKKNLLDLAVKCNALRFGEFTLKSGRVSPYFFNAGLLSTGEALDVMASSYAELIMKKNITFDVIFGPAYKGIPLSASIAMKLFSDYGVNVGYAFNRKEAKDHGEGGVLVGEDLTGKRVLIVDDVITAGTAIVESLSILKPLSAEIVGVALALDREEKGRDLDTSAVQQISEKYNLPVHTIINVTNILDYMSHDEKFEEYIESFIEYRQQYGT